METNSGIYIIFLVIVVVIWLLPIILFFKVWGMCNDVKEIKEILERFEYNNSTPS
jgi:hypothetical protein